MTESPDPQTATRGGYLLPPPPRTGDYVGPVDDPDRYELAGAGASGGEGTTWKARYHGRLQRPLPLAVKQLRPPPGAGPGWPGDEDRQRWQDQAALLRHIRPDHVVHLHEIFSGPPPHQAGKARADDPQSAYLVMEWIDGPTLSELCRGVPATRATVATRLGYVEQVAAALGELSSATRSAGNPSLHRDIKPSNCIVHDERGLVLIDISTLRLIEDGFDPVGRHTPQYTAPEVLAAPHLPRSPATEVYALGALALFCLTGRDPSGSDPAAGLETAARRAGAAQPAALAEHIRRTLDADPARRPTDLQRWSRRLRELSRPRPRRLASSVGAAAIVLLVAAFLVLGPPRLGRSGQTPGAAGRPSSAAASGITGSITSPGDGADVKQCSYFSGTAKVPAGMTLVLTMRNLVNGDPVRYDQAVFSWDDPAALTHWRGYQYFGNADDTVGQDYRVELLAAKIADVRAWHDDSASDAGSKLAAKSILLDRVDLHRIAGAGPDHECSGP